MNKYQSTDGGLRLLLPNQLTVVKEGKNFFASSPRSDNCISIDIAPSKASVRQFSNQLSNPINAPPTIECIEIRSPLAKTDAIKSQRIIQNSVDGSPITFAWSLWITISEIDLIVQIVGSGSFAESSGCWTEVISSIQLE